MPFYSNCCYLFVCLIIENWILNCKYIFDILICILFLHKLLIKKKKQLYIVFCVCSYFFIFFHCQRLKFNFCTYHKAPFPLVYCRWFSENKLIQFDVNWQCVTTVTSTIADRIGHSALEIVGDNAPIALPKRGRNQLKY